MGQVSFIFSTVVSLSCCAFTITFRKPDIASLEIWRLELWTDGLLDTCKLWTVGPFDYNLIQMNMTTPLTTVP